MRFAPADILKVVVAALVLTGPSVVAEQTAGTEPIGAPRTEPTTMQFDIGADTRRRFRILISVPSAPPPPEGYGIIYALDAAWSFGTLRDAVNIQTVPRRNPDTAPTIAVGIGWPTDTLVDLQRRTVDLTGKAEHGPGWADTLRMIETELMPHVATRYKTDPNRTMLLGHSFGGSFALEVRRARPDLFSHIAAGSPSIWTNPDLLSSAQKTGPATLITIGELENPTVAITAGVDPDRVSRLEQRAMYDRALQMAHATGAVFVDIPNLGHGASATPFIAHAVNFLWGETHDP